MKTLKKKQAVSTREELADIIEKKLQDSIKNMYFNDDSNQKKLDMIREGRI